MPDDVPGPDDWWATRQAWKANRLLKQIQPMAITVAAIAAVFAGCQSFKTDTRVENAHNEAVVKLDEVAVKADTAAAKTEETKTTVDAKTAVSEKKLDRIEKSATATETVVVETHQSQLEKAILDYQRIVGDEFSSAAEVDAATLLRSKAVKQLEELKKAKDGK